MKRDDGTTGIEWLGPSKHTATDLATAGAAADDHSAVREAGYVLYSILAEGSVPAKDVIRLAGFAGVRERTLKRAKRELGVRSWKKGSGSGSQWFWQLPEDEELLRPFKDKDIDQLMDHLIYGVDEPPQQTSENEHHPERHNDNLDDDDEGDEGAWEIR